MEIEQVALLAIAFALIAALYSTIGHGGASGYLMVMGVVGISPALMKPTALSLNLVVAATGMILFARAGGFRGRTLWPFLVTSIPAAFIGGWARLDPTVYRSLVGAVRHWGDGNVNLKVALRFAPVAMVGSYLGARLSTLISGHVQLTLFAVVMFVAAVFMYRDRRPAATSDGMEGHVQPAAGRALWLIGLQGLSIGVLTGLVGVGGGIFLSPLLMLAGWATAKQTAGVSAAFILANSAAGLGGIVVRQHGLAWEPGAMTIFAATVLVGGFVGSAIGSRCFGHMTLRRALAVVLVLAGLKMMFLSSPAPSSETPPAVGPGA